MRFLNKTHVDLHATWFLIVFVSFLGRKICFGLEPKQIFLPTKLTNTIKSHHRATSTKRFLEKQKEFTVKKLKRPNFVKKINSKTHLEYDQRIRAPPKELSFHAMKGNIIERETESPNCFPFCLKWLAYTKPPKA